VGRPVLPYRDAVAAAVEGASPKAVVFDSCGSTNDEARDLAREGAPHLTVVTAEVQTAGRGRRGRTWMSAAGQGLHTSIVLRPDLPVERWTLLPPLTGVAAMRAVRHRAKVPVGLKWPNDLVVNNRKLGGILVEAEPPAFAVAGIGINVAQTAFEGELAEIATSLAREQAVRLDRADLLGAIVRYLDEALGDPEAAMERYRRDCVTLGRAVRIMREGVPDLVGIGAEIDDRGALIVDVEGGTEIVTAGDVVHLRPDPPRV
jgi:BirA family transcriptional regulator, biotin operon repressor / biotin---[acetyl-CoA-carboxylase] ligase